MSRHTVQSRDTRALFFWVADEIRRRPYLVVLSCAIRLWIVDDIDDAPSRISAVVAMPLSVGLAIGTSGRFLNFLRRNRSLSQVLSGVLAT
jgi:hypothetical protein